MIRADPREPAAGGKLVAVVNSVSEFGTGIEGEALIGHSLPLLLLSGASRDRSIVLGIQGSVFGRFQMERVDRDLISTDWVFAIPLVVWRGESWFRLRYRHISSHLGDEYIERFEAERFNFSRDAMEITAYWRMFPGFSAYAGGDVAINIEPLGSKRLGVLGGVEYEDVAGNGSGRFFGGVNVVMDQELSWQPRVNVQSGMMLFPHSDRHLRFTLDVSFGQSFQGQFREEKETVLMLGLLVDL